MYSYKSWYCKRKGLQLLNNARIMYFVRYSMNAVNADAECIWNDKQNYPFFDKVDLKKIKKLIFAGCN